ncbi:hypothetical protein FIBSPDRAFT_902602 [Athelia psychrophila]|uniref:Uncharacterized protein n=1 Tax=Athelia psychrophila TaxID=1759441 RepID=A0A167X174_9AGAM|nr:hypothetical protein FIBSPDRAFT_902602 [Fibularhizoctonia sp. CBS 109695]
MWLLKAVQDMTDDVDITRKVVADGNNKQSIAVLSIAMARMAEQSTTLQAWKAKEEKAATPSYNNAPRVKLPTQSRTTKETTNNKHVSEIIGSSAQVPFTEPEEESDHDVSASKGQQMSNDGDWLYLSLLRLCSIRGVVLETWGVGSWRRKGEYGVAGEAIYDKITDPRGATVRLGVPHAKTPHRYGSGRVGGEAADSEVPLPWNVRNVRMRLGCVAEGMGVWYEGGSESGSWIEPVTRRNVSCDTQSMSMLYNEDQRQRDMEEDEERLRLIEENETRDNELQAKIQDAHEKNEALKQKITKLNGTCPV